MMTQPMQPIKMPARLSCPRSARVRAWFMFAPSYIRSPAWGVGLRLKRVQYTLRHRESEPART